MALGGTGRGLTARARRVMERAQKDVPAEFNHNYVGTETLLMALVEETDGLGAQVLARHGITPQLVHDAIETIVGRGDAPPTKPPELTPRARKVLGLAVEEAARLDHPFVGTGHLLLGVIREGQGIAAAILERGTAAAGDLRDAASPGRTEGAHQGREPGAGLADLRDAVLHALANHSMPLVET